VDRFKCGRTTLDDEEQSEPLTSWPDDHLAEVDALIKENRWIMVSDIAVTVSIIYGSACVIILNNLSYPKVCARWVPHHLMEDHRQACLWISEGFLQRHSWEGEDLLQQIAQMTKHGSIITNPALNSRVGSGNTPHLLKQKNPSPRPVEVNWCCSCFGTVMVWYWNITLGKAPLFLLHHTVNYWHQSWNHWITKSTEFCCPGGLFFSTIKHVHILQQPLLKPSGTWYLNCFHTPHIVWP